jgi:ribosomal protein L29
MSNFKTMSVADLEAKVLENRKLLLDLRFQKKLGNQVKVHMFRKLKREIAMIKTLLNERDA